MHGQVSETLLNLHRAMRRAALVLTPYFRSQTHLKCKHIAALLRALIVMRDKPTVQPKELRLACARAHAYFLTPARACTSFSRRKGVGRRFKLKTTQTYKRVNPEQTWTEVVDGFIAPLSETYNGKKRKVHTASSVAADKAKKEKKWCVCKGPEEGLMVECKSCKSWFHEDCLFKMFRLRIPPKGKKLDCPVCKLLAK
jgi:hypothetical protein